LHQSTSPEAIETAWPYLNHSDRFVRYAARIAVEHQPVNTWSSKALTEANSTKSIFAVMALIRADKNVSKTEAFKALHKINYDNLTAADKLDLMRVYELLFARTGQPEVTHKAQFIARYMPKFPTSDDEINRQMAKLLIFLETPGIASKVIRSGYCKGWRRIGCFRRGVNSKKPSLRFRHCQNVRKTAAS
jgi:hypothetical protein